MPLPTSPTWDLADFDETTLAGLLALGPGNVSLSPGAFPYFSYPRPSVLRVSSSDGVEGSADLITAIPSRFTLELVARFPQLPNNAGDLDDHRLGITVADDGGRGFSLYFSASGISISRVDDFGSAVLTPDSGRIVQEAESQYQTFRLAVDSGLGRVYVYISPGITDTPVHRYTLPVEQTPPGLTDIFRLFAKGAASQPVAMEIARLRLSSSLVISDYPPVANAGPDRVAPSGQAIRFDGRGSYDLEGGALSYRWQLTDAPYNSIYATEASGSTVDDGDTDGLTSILSFAPGGLPGWVMSGDVLRIRGVVAEISSADIPGGSLTVLGSVIPDNLVSEPFRIFRQSFLVDADTETPYAVPDIQGIYRVRLTVNDGIQNSEHAEVLASVVGARAPFGVEPDTSFIWSALGDEWELIENRDVFQEAWTGVAQLLSGKLLEAWQYQYNLSIRDAQPTFQRKWVAYPTLLAETNPDAVELKMVYGGFHSTHHFETGDVDFTGTLVITYFTGDGLDDVDEVEVVFSAGDLQTVVSELNTALVGTGITARAAATMTENGAVRYEGPAATADDGDGDGYTALISTTPGVLPSWVSAGDILVVDYQRFVVASVDVGLGEITVTSADIPDNITSVLRVYRACRLFLSSSTRGFTVSGVPGLGFEDRLSYLQGTGGAAATADTYIAEAGINFEEFGVGPDDILVVNNGQSLRIRRVLSGRLDPNPGQRLLLDEPCPVDVSTEWAVPSILRSAELDFDTGLAYPGDVGAFEIFDRNTRVVTDARSLVVSPRQSDLAVHLNDLYGAVLDLDRYELRFNGVRRRKALPLYPETVSVPRLQDKIPLSADPLYLRENVDYIIEPFYRDINEQPIPVLQFRDATFIDPDLDPPDTLWAEVTIFDNSHNIEVLFGELAGFLRDDAANLGPDFNYSAGVGGVLFGYQRGPTLSAIQIGAQILFGQSFSEANGIILEIRDDFSPLRGRMLVQDDDGLDPPQTETVRTYYYVKDPLDLSDTSGLALNPQTSAPWAAGDSIPQFSPIGAGVDIVDTKKDPDWFVPLVRGGMMTEVERFHSFLVRFNLDLVTLTNLMLLYQFVLRMKPTYSHPILLGMRYHDEDIDPIDEVNMSLRMNLFDSVCGDGRSYMYDDYRGDGTLWSSFDDGVTHYDALTDCPTDVIEFCMTLAWGGGPITFDSIFFLDTEVTDLTGAHTGVPGTTFVPTYDLNLPAGDYRVCAMIKQGPLVMI